jgi:hypothetical protein
MFSNRPNRLMSLNGVSLIAVASSFTIELRGVTTRSRVGLVPGPDAGALIAAFPDVVEEGLLEGLRRADIIAEKNVRYCVLDVFMSS